MIPQIQQVVGSQLDWTFCYIRIASLSTGWYSLERLALIIMRSK